MKEAVSIATNDFYLQMKTDIVDKLEIGTDEKNVKISLTVPLRDINKVIYDDDTLSLSDGDAMYPRAVRKLIDEFNKSLTDAREQKEQHPNVYVITREEYERLSRAHSHSSDDD